MNTPTKPARDKGTCGSCGLTHSQVEAGGIWYCPNPACTMTGAAWFRTKLPSTRDEGSHHYVDEGEWIEAVADWIANTKDDRVIQDAAYASLQRLKEKFKGGEE